MTATDPLALEGRDGAAADRGHADRPRALAASCSRRSPSTSPRRSPGVIVAGRQLDPELREPLAHLAERRRLPDPRRADLAAALRAPRPLARDRRLRPAAARRALPRPARARPGPALRRDADQQAAARLAGGARGADQIVVDPRGGWNEPTRPRGGDPARRPDRARRRLGGAGRAAATASTRELWRRAERRRGARRSRPSSRGDGPITEPGLQLALGARTATATSSTPPRACRSATRRPSCRRPRPTPSSSATAAPTGSTAWSPPGSAPPRRAAGRRRSSPATSASSTTSAASPPCATSTPRCASSSSTTTAAASSTSCRRPRRSTGEEFEALLGTPRGVERRARPPTSSASPTGALDSLAELPDALAAGTGLIEVPVDRRRTSSCTAASTLASQALPPFAEGSEAAPSLPLLLREGPQPSDAAAAAAPAA